MTLTAVIAVWLIHCIMLSAASTPLAQDHENVQCVALSSEGSELNRHLCEMVGLTACKEPSAILTINSSIVSDSINREHCLQTLFGVLASITCQRSSPSDQHIYSPKPNGIAVAYLCQDVCKAVWMACSPRANSPFLELLVEEEAKTICKNIANARSAVQIRQGSYGKCNSKIIPMTESDVAEINWLLGGKVNWHFLKLRRYSLGIIVLLLALAMCTAYTKLGYKKRLRRMLETKRKEQETESFLELNVNLY